LRVPQRPNGAGLPHEFPHWRERFPPTEWGKSLLLVALDWFASQGAKEVRVVTQGKNIAAQRLYQRCGFVIRDLQLWYHKWYSTPVIPNA